MLVTDELTPIEETKYLRKRWIKTVNQLKDSTDLPNSKVKELQALIAYTEIRLLNLQSERGEPDAICTT